MFEVEQPRDAGVLEHELERVVGDEPGRSEAILRNVVSEPPAEERGQRIGGQALHQRVVERLQLAPVTPEGGSGRVDGNREPGTGGSRERDVVDPGEDLEVVVEHSLAIRLVGDREVHVARKSIHHERVRVVAQAVRVRNRNAVRFEQVVGRHLVGDPVRHDDLQLALATRVEWQDPPVHLDVDVPGGTPPRQASHPGDPSPDLAFDPGREPRLLVHETFRLFKANHAGQFDDCSRAIHCPTSSGVRNPRGSESAKLERKPE